MGSKEIIDFLEFLAVSGGLFGLFWKGIIEYFKSIKEERVRSVEEMIDRKIDARVQGLERRLSEMNQEFHKSIIEIFKEFK